MQAGENRRAAGDRERLRVFLTGLVLRSRLHSLTVERHAMIAFLFSPFGHIGRRAYIAPIAGFFALALVSAFSTGVTLSGSSVGHVLDNPWTVIGRGLDAALLSALPTSVALSLVIALFTTALWALFALTIKRLHDLGRSGWWSALLLVPGISVLLMLFCTVAPTRQPTAA
jgi:uncharacterized membrane protein YhaH (DUF805 family)